MYALILAGGRGERLRPLTDSIPKPMVLLNGKPILWYQTQWLTNCGVTDVVFLAGYRWEAIKEFFGDGKDYGFNAHYSIEDSPLGRGGAIRRAMSEIPRNEKSVFVTNGDVITGEDLSNVLHKFHNSQQISGLHMATLMVVPMVSPYGIVDLSDLDHVEDFREKAELPYWINGGIYVFSRRIRRELPELGDHESSTLPALAAQHRLTAFSSRAFWRSVDSAKDLREAEDFLKSRE